MRITGLLTRLAAICCIVSAPTACKGAGAPVDEAGPAYYLDSEQGDDANDGRSPQRAWRSLDRANNQLFEPGERLLLRSGCKWQGQLRPQGSGSEGKPIRIGRYGAGELPVIDQGAMEGAVVQLQDQDWWEIAGIAITASGSATNRHRVSGIRVAAVEARRVLHHIVIKDCELYGLHGMMKVYEDSAIWVGVPGWSDKPEGTVNGANNPGGYAPTFSTGFNGVTIEGNTIRDTDRCGILVWSTSNPSGEGLFMADLIPSRNVVVRGNRIENIAGDAILVLGSHSPLIEHNVVRRACLKSGDPQYSEAPQYWAPSSAAVWMHHCTGGVIQHNAVYNSAKQMHNNDGMSYNFDYYCIDCLIQYNYSKNNAGGFLLIMPTARGNIARYNISENDTDHVLYLQSGAGQQDNNMVCNNTFWIDRGDAYITPYAVVVNNIFHVTGGATIAVRSPEAGTFSNNCYSGSGWSTLPDDPAKVTADPMFADGGAGGDNAENLAGYSLSAASLCRRRGQPIENNGGRDILGNILTEGTATDIGAIQYVK